MLFKINFINFSFGCLAKVGFLGAQYSSKGYVQVYLAKTFIYDTPEVIVYRGRVLIAVIVPGTRSAIFW
ncbi:hypothetical protein [Sphingobacterium sp.]|uniref:hypothetical protein n=1 Tax=Sphingobacterium sp. TaxID=341027 RepID=UPI00289CFA45|nr:hypothetical protein [Sphingobacterium sp.]